MGSERLAEALEQIEFHVSQGALPCVVFDLDSTLFTTGPRNKRILTEFAEVAEPRFAGITEAAAKIAPETIGWSLLDALAAQGMSDAYMQAQLMAFWKARFFTDAYVISDGVLAGAVDFVTACHDRGANVYYLTGRHVSDMGAGTVRAITDAGLPFWRGRTSLHLKAAFDIPDLEHKLGAIADIRSYGGPVVATFENEPENANLFLEQFPDGMHFFLLTEHSPKPVQPHADLIRIKDFTLPQ